MHIVNKKKIFMYKRCGEALTKAHVNSRPCPESPIPTS